MDNFFLTTHDAVDYMLAELEDHGFMKPKVHHIEEQADEEVAKPGMKGRKTMVADDGEEESREAEGDPLALKVGSYKTALSALEPVSEEDLERGASSASRWS